MRASTGFSGSGEGQVLGWSKCDIEIPCFGKLRVSEDMFSPKEGATPRR